MTKGGHERVGSEMREAEKYVNKLFPKTSFLFITCHGTTDGFT